MLKVLLRLVLPMIVAMSILIELASISLAMINEPNDASVVLGTMLLVCSMFFYVWFLGWLIRRFVKRFENETS